MGTHCFLAGEQFALEHRVARAPPLTGGHVDRALLRGRVPPDVVSGLGPAGEPQRGAAHDRVFETLSHEGGHDLYRPGVRLDTAGGQVGLGVAVVAAAREGLKDGEQRRGAGLAAPGK